MNTSPQKNIEVVPRPLMDAILYQTRSRNWGIGHEHSREPVRTTADLSRRPLR